MHLYNNKLYGHSDWQYEDLYAISQFMPIQWYILGLTFVRPHGFGLLKTFWPQNGINYAKIQQKFICIKYDLKCQQLWPFTTHINGYTSAEDIANEFCIDDEISELFLRKDFDKFWHKWKDKFHKTANVQLILMAIQVQKI